MSFYNAVIRWDSTSGIFARGYISPITPLPPTWVICYGGDYAGAGTPEAKEFIGFASSTRPLQVFMGYPSPYDPYEITLKMSGKTLKLNNENLPLGIHTKIEDVKKVIKDKEGIALSEQWLFFEGIELERGKSLTDYNITTGSIVDLRMNLGGSSLSTLSALKCCQIAYKGVGSNGKKWLSYSGGLNLEGTCSKKGCESTGGNVIRQMGYGVVVLTPADNKYNCPACKTSFTPSNFFVSMGRALFRFKKAGEKSEAVEILLESVTDSIEVYKEIASKPGYDLVEIRTVLKSQSPYSCVGCGCDISMKDREVLPKCGHAQHQKCSKGGCSACKAPFWNKSHFEFGSWMENVLQGE